MSRSPSEFTAGPRTGAAKPRSSDVLRSAVDLFVQAPTHERAEVRAFADLVTGLLADVDRADRVHVAEKLARRADTPPALARLLAMDAIEVADPVIRRSPVLTSADLVEIMRRGPAHVAVVAERLDLSADIAATLTRSSEIETSTRVSRRAEAARTAERVTPDETAIEAIVAQVARDMPFAGSEDEAEVALQRALDELAAELAAEAEAHDAEVAADRAAREAAPEVPGDIDAFLNLDSAGRWRFIQDHDATASLSPSPSRRRRLGDPAAIGARCFAALVGEDRKRLGDDLAEATGLDRAVVARILNDRHGEALAVALAALGIDERTATSILLLHTGERATLGHMQDLSAMAGRIGWRTAEQILSTWRGGRAGGRGETLRVLDPAERREGVRGEALGGVDRGRVGEDLGRRRGGES